MLKKETFNINKDILNKIAVFGGISDDNNTYGGNRESREFSKKSTV